MPLALDPESKFKLVLKSDADKPEGQQPAFIFKHLTGRQWRQLGEKYDSLEDIDGTADCADLIYECVLMFMVGWENMKDREGKDIPFDPSKIEDIIGMAETQELINRVLRYTPDFTDKKKFDSPSPSDTEPSVKNAEE